MEKEISLIKIILILIIVNAAGALLTYFDLDTYFIFLGFRFQLSLCLPFLFVFKLHDLHFIKNLLLHPKSKKNLFFFFLIIVPVIIILAILFFLKEIEIEDPEYFYEFGLSSIPDYPIYLIWNSVQLFIFFYFLIKMISDIKLKFSITALTIIFLFAYFFIPYKGEEFSYFQLGSLVLYSIIIGFLLKYFQNIYWLIIFSFSVLWLNILLFGSGSEMLIRLLFASRYNSWEGFFSVPKDYRDFILPAQLFITLIIILLTPKREKES